MDGSNGNVVSLLERIVDELKGVREGQSAMQGELVAVHVEQAAMREEMREEMRGVRLEIGGLRRDLTARIDNVIAFMGTHHGDHEERIRALEERVLGKSG